MVVYFGNEVAEALKQYMQGDRKVLSLFPGMRMHCSYLLRDVVWVYRLLRIW